MNEFVFETLRSLPPLEIAAVITGVIYALLAVRRNRWAWAFGAVSSLCLVWLAAGARLPLQAVLQGVYVAMAAYGFWHWSRSSGASEPVRIVRWAWRSHALALALVVVATFVLAPLLAAYTSAASPWLDALVMGLSLLATFMTARAVLENWLYWLVVDAVSFVLYGRQGLKFVALLYAIYFFIALVGLLQWRWQYRQAKT